MKYKWLHISDIHSISGIKTKIMRMALLEEIADINKESSFSFILITGDISNKNTGYKEAKELILEIAERISVPKERIYLVPGNHDVDREEPLNRKKMCENLWNKEIIEDYSIVSKLTEGQKKFFTTYTELMGKDYGVDTLHFFEIFDKNLAIIHLNTAWMCCDSDNESGKLHLGLKALLKVMENKTLKETPIRIAIGHHRVEDFNEVVKNNFRTILKTEDIDLYLGGHCHQANVIYDPTINVEFCSCRQARAEDSEYPAGFIIGNIDTDNDQSCFEFYSWDTTLSKWTYDYTVNPAKHGKYYLNNTKFKKADNKKKNVLIDLKLMNLKLDIKDTIEKFKHLNNSEIYRTSLYNIYPNSLEEWARFKKEIQNLYTQIIENSDQNIHVFPLAPIPILVYFGFLLQNDASNVFVYQYNENARKWVYDEENTDNNINVQESLKSNDSRILAVSVSVSGQIKEEDISNVLNQGYDLLAISIDSPRLSKLNYKDDVQGIKTQLKIKLDEILSNYEELHLFLAAPAGLCIEIGRIVRKNLYPTTYVYDYNRQNNPKYKRIFNLMDCDC